jgi:carboxypeptidase Taq
MSEELKKVRSVLAEAQNYHHACAVLNFDQETICPSKGVQEQGEVNAYLSNQAFRLLKDPAFEKAAEAAYAQRADFDEVDRTLVSELHKRYLHTKNVSPELDHEFSLIYNKAFVDWLGAREASDYSMFEEALTGVRDVCVKEVGLRAEDADFPKAADLYDNLLDDYETGITTADLDTIFGRCKERLLPLLKKIVASPKKIRTDFLSVPASDAQQREMADWLLHVLDYDFSRGGWTTTEHPFTSTLGKNDIRVTTHFYPDMFYASMYSIIHECGHALFDQLTPIRHHESYIGDCKTMGMHESVSRFYENRIGRSEAFIHLIYPKVCEVFPQVMEGVSERELYEAMNLVEPSLIRTEADELTYTIHIIIRYEIEKEFIAGRVSAAELPALWRAKYKEYLGIEPQTDREGILQDVHWTFGFGYFPTYAIGNFYNAMYYNRLVKELDLDSIVAAGDFKTLNEWMSRNVFAKADLQTPKEWIKGITGRSLTPDDFLDYLEEKYSRLYGL